MIKISVIASGSKGNCYRISDGKSVLMIECGVRFKKIREGFNFNVSGVSGCLISHEHGDHCGYIKDVIKSGVNCYMSKGTGQALNLSGHRVKIVENLKQFKIGSFTVLPFDTKHDSAEPFGYLIQSGLEKLLFITDSYYCKYQFSGVTHLMVECNYSEDILNENIRKGIINPVMAKRVRKSHFELSRVKEFFLANDLSKAKEIHLLHLSDSNSDEKLFKNEIQSIAGIPVFVH